VLNKIKRLFDLKLLKTTAALTGGRAFHMMVSIVLMLIQSRYIEPETAGSVAYFFIPLGYLWILSLGIPSALARELPFHLAKGEREQAVRLAKSTMTFSVIVGGLCSLGFVTASVRALVMGRNFNAVGWAVASVGAFFTIYNLYILTTYRTTDEFVTVAKSNTVTAISNLAVFPLIFVNPYLGLFAKQTVTPVVQNIYLHIKRPFKLKFGMDHQDLWRLFKFGFPLIAITYFETGLWTSTQSALIVTYLGTKNLGLYSFINHMLLALLIIPHAVADILRPKFAAVYGQTNGSLRKTLAVAVKPLGLTLLVSLAAILFCRLVIGDIIAWLMPRYIDAIPAFNYALLLVPVNALACIKYIFVVSKSTVYNAVSTISGFLVGIGLLYWGLKRGMEFKYVFVPYVIGRFTNFAMTVILLFIESVRRKKRKNEKKDHQVAGPVV